MTFERKLDKEQDLSGQLAGGATREVLAQARALAEQIERLLTSPRCNFAESDGFRVRLARAHTLSLLDQLGELLGPLESVHRLRRAVRDEEEGTTSEEIRPVWR
jgi:hypothetical protein